MATKGKIDEKEFLSEISSYLQNSTVKDCLISTPGNHSHKSSQEGWLQSIEEVAEANKKILDLEF